MQTTMTTTNAALDEQESKRGPSLPHRMTISSAVEAAEAVKSLCEDIISDYETAKDDPENNVSGWRETDDASEFIGMTSEHVYEARTILAVGARL